MSLDYGKTWRRTEFDTNMNTNNFYFKYDDIYALTDYGLYKSTDKGKNWDILGLDGKIYSMTIDENDNMVAVVGLKDDGGYNSLMASRNRGYGWKNKRKLSSNSYCHVYYLKGKYYCINCLPYQHGVLGEIFVSEDVFDNIDTKYYWRHSDSKQERFKSVEMNQNGNILFFFDDYNLYFHWKEDEDSLYTYFFKNVHGINSAIYTKDNHIFVAINSNQDGVFHSSDDGKSWVELYEGLNNSKVLSLAMDSLGILYAGTDKGIYKSKQSFLSNDYQSYKKDFSINYNDFLNNLNINLIGSCFTNNETKIEIFDFMGKIVFNSSYFIFENENKLSIDLSGFNQGIYFIRITLSNKLIQDRFIKLR